MITTNQSRKQQLRNDGNRRIIIKEIKVIEKLG